VSVFDHLVFIFKQFQKEAKSVNLSNTVEYKFGPIIVKHNYKIIK